MYSLRLLLSLIMVGFVAAPAAAENSDPASTGTWQSQGRPSLYGSDDENADQEGDDSEAAGTARGRMGVSREGSDIGSGGVQSLGGDDLDPETAGAGTGTGSNDNMGRTQRMPGVESDAGGNTGGGGAVDQNTSTMSGTGRTR